MKRWKIYFAMLLTLACSLVVVPRFSRVLATPALAPDRAEVSVPAGTVLTVRMIDPVDSSKNHPGEEFAGTLAEPVVVGDRVAIPKGAEARTRLLEAKNAGHIKGRSELELALVEITVNGKAYPVETGLYEREGKSRGKHSAKVIGGGAGLGALIGAAIGGKKGAAVGAATGAGAGTAVEAVTRGEQVKIPSEAKVEFTLKNSLTISR